ncbi:hypothetical protein 20Sep420_00097 [Pseudomonas phage 20Sep420]|nr:hypothetical protein 20Sep420_00097 [Pseudomonas phage 20Sep420]
MGKSDNYKVKFVNEKNVECVDGQPNFTRKAAKHRAKQLANNNFKLTDFVIVHPDGHEEILSLE